MRARFYAEQAREVYPSGDEVSNVKTFEITIQEKADAAAMQRVDLNGFLDAHTVREFDQEMAQLLAAGATQVVLGLENLIPFQIHEH